MKVIKNKIIIKEMISYSIIIILLIIVIVLYVIVYCESTDLIKFNVEYKETLENSYDYDIIRISNINVYDYFYGNVNKINDEIIQYNIGNENVNLFEVGLIINEDFLQKNKIVNLPKGRIVDIVEIDNCQKIYIDTITNYDVELYLDINDCELYNDMRVGNVYSAQTQNSIIFIKLEKKEFVDFSKGYLLSFSLEDLDRYIYNDTIITYKILNKEYYNAKYINTQLIKEITNDYNVVITEIINENGIEKLIDREYKIIDYCDNKIIIDINEYETKKFVIYNNYIINKLKEKNNKMQKANNQI